MRKVGALNILWVMWTAMSLSVLVDGRASADPAAYPPVLLGAGAGPVVGDDLLSIAGFQAQGTWCRYPNATARKAAPVAGFAQLMVVGEVEPNDTAGTAQVIPLGNGGGQDRDLDITGSISSSSDVDFYRFTAVKGDVLRVDGVDFSVFA